MPSKDTFIINGNTLLKFNPFSLELFPDIKEQTLCIVPILKVRANFSGHVFESWAQSQNNSTLYDSIC